MAKYHSSCEQGINNREKYLELMGGMDTLSRETVLSKLGIRGKYTKCIMSSHY